MCVNLVEYFSGDEPSYISRRRGRCLGRVGSVCVCVLVGSDINTSGHLFIESDHPLNKCFFRQHWKALNCCGAGVRSRAFRLL